jgi:N-acetylglucosaminyldiphosphoundecaprenol N-acetyl-beta-D-mannosaminyltransferase
VKDEKAIALETEIFELKQAIQEPAAPCYRVLGVRVNAVDLEGAVLRIEDWIAERKRARWVAVMNVHMVMTARDNADFEQVVSDADMVVPDGMPLVWTGRRSGFPGQTRVAGPDLFATFLEQTHECGYRHFFYGGTPEVLDALAIKVQAQYPKTKIVGTYAPPFRPLTPEEDAQAVAMINDADPDVIWVGLGCPKQERWMYEHRDRLHSGVMLGIGQVFDIYAGKIRRAPAWMQRTGIEWFYRLCAEPRRLWRRYLVYNVRFLAASFGRDLARARND